MTIATRQIWTNIGDFRIHIARQSSDAHPINDRWIVNTDCGMMFEGYVTKETTNARLIEVVVKHVRQEAAKWREFVMECCKEESQGVAGAV